MKAAILTEYNQPMVIEEVTPLGLGRHDVRVQIEASGVCHSDVTIAAGGVPLPPPIILGHEGAGTVVEVGPDGVRDDGSGHVRR